jgi:hypothetical protein
MIPGALAAAATLVPVAQPAVAEPMKCTTEQQRCVAACGKFSDQKVWRVCMTACSQRLAACQRTGCWDNGSNTYCGLLRH